MPQNIFVFVVCGAQEHIDTLHFSLKALKHYSKNRIIVLTDSSRNEIPIEHNDIIDIKTPTEFDHHQASIYLKTGIYKFVPKGNNYCYLDTDIIALNQQVDDIFKEYVSPITFAPDHCVLNKFSSYAINCGCHSRWLSDRAKFDEMISMVKKYGLEGQSEELKAKRQELEHHFEIINKNFLLKIKTAIRFGFSYPIFYLNNNFCFDKKKKVWLDQDGNILMYHIKLNYKKIKKETGLSYSFVTQRWTNEQGEDIWEDKCPHLVEYIDEKFNIKVRQQEWQHWNGGVFLFNDSSHHFLEAWFTKTMEIFKDSKWKTRDQGTLIATAWEFKLQNHSTLSRAWNLIADYHNPYLKWVENGNVQLGEKEFIIPILCMYIIILEILIGNFGMN